MNRRDRLYNYIVNTFGISKEMIFEYIDKRLEDLISKHLESKLESNAVQKMILDRVTTLVDGGIRQRYYANENFNVWFHRTAKEIIKEELLKRYDVSVLQKAKDE